MTNIIKEFLQWLRTPMQSEMARECYTEFYEQMEKGDVE